MIQKLICVCRRCGGANKSRFKLMANRCRRLPEKPLQQCCWLQGDAVRIGRGNHLGQPYYNLEIKTKYLRDERNIYRSLLETIKLIKESSRQQSARN